MSTPAAGPPPFVLVFIPATQEFHNEYELAIVPACRAAGAYVERADDHLAPDDLLQRIQNLIAKADLVIAEMTSRNESVFYDTGYAHALGKPVILLTKKAEDIPFDLQHYPHIVHEEGRLAESLKPELERRVRHLLDLGARGLPPPAAPVNVVVEGTWLTTDAPRPVVLYNVGDTQRSFWVTMRHEAIRNATRPVTLQVGVIAPARFKTVSGDGDDLDGVPLDDGTTRLHLLAKEFTILPGSWERAVFRVHVGQRRVGDAPDSFAIRVFTDDGFFDFPFTAEGVP